MDVFRNREYYPTTFCASPVNYAVLAGTYASVFQRYAWNNVMLIRDTATAAPFYVLWLQLSLPSIIKSMGPKFSAKVLDVRTIPDAQRNGTFVDALIESGKQSRG